MDPLDREHVLSQVDAMLWLHARNAWFQLPRVTQIWVDVEDLHSEAQLIALKSVDRWDETRGSLSTIIYLAVAHGLSTFVSRMRAQKRYARDSVFVSLDVLDVEVQSPLLDPVVDAVVAWVLS